MNLFLIRHGETLPNQRREFQGTGNFPLNETGIRQAELIASYFDGVQLDAIYVSPMTRAMQTAIPLSGVSGVSVEQVPAFREVDCGRWEGLSFVKVLEEEETLLRGWLTDGKTRAPGGESLGDVHERIQDPLKEIVLRHRETAENVVILAHGAVNRAIICSLLSLQTNRAFCFDQGNACISEFIVENLYPPRLTMLNYTAHLGG